MVSIYTNIIELENNKVPKLKEAGLTGTALHRFARPSLVEEIKVQQNINGWLLRKLKCSFTIQG